jgi:hypothetical protein
MIASVSRSGPLGARTFASASALALMGTGPRQTPHDRRRLVSEAYRPDRSRADSSPRTGTNIADRGSTRSPSYFSLSWHGDLAVLIHRRPNRRALGPRGRPSGPKYQIPKSSATRVEGVVFRSIAGRVGAAALSQLVLDHLNLSSQSGVGSTLHFVRPRRKRVFGWAAVVVAEASPNALRLDVQATSWPCVL